MLNLKTAILLATLATVLLVPLHAYPGQVTSPGDALTAQRLTNLYGLPIPVELARIVTAAAIAEGKKNNWMVAVAVVDPGGALVYFERIDGTQTGSIDLAIEKARTAVAFKRSTKMLEDRVIEGRLQYLRQSGSIPIEGGVPLIVDNRIVGAIGVSGVRSEQDGVCAKAAVEALIKALSQTN